VCRKADLRELKVLQKIEKKQFQDLMLKAQYVRDQQMKKFEHEMQVLSRSGLVLPGAHLLWPDNPAVERRTCDQEVLNLKVELFPRLHITLYALSPSRAQTTIFFNINIHLFWLPTQSPPPQSRTNNIFIRNVHLFLLHTQLSEKK